MTPDDAIDIIDIPYDDCVKLTNNIYNNIETIINNQNIKNFIDASDNIINKYIDLFPALTYHEAVSLYIGISLIICYQ